MQNFNSKVYQKITLLKFRSMTIHVCRYKESREKKAYKETKRKEESMIDGKSFGDDINGVDDPRKVPKQCQNQTYPKLSLQQTNKQKNSNFLNLRKNVKND